MKIINESHSNKDNQLKHLMGMYGMNEGVSSAVQNWLDDENEDDDTLSYDFDDAFDFDNGEVTHGGKFIEDGREWTWVRQVSDVAHLDFDSWAVWMAISPQDENNPGGPNDVAFFIVDVDNGFIDWGPVESADEANEFLQSKIDDYEMDESLKDGVDILSPKKFGDGNDNGVSEDLQIGQDQNSFVSPVVNKKADGSYLVKNKDGKSYTAFDKDDKPVGSITTNNENDAKNKFTSNKYDESVNEDFDEKSVKHISLDVKDEVDKVVSKLGINKNKSRMDEIGKKLLKILDDVMEVDDSLDECKNELK